MKIILFIGLLLPLLLKAQSLGPDQTQTLAASEFNPNDLIIDQIECVGNETTSCDLIQKEVYLEVGDKVNEDELSNAKIRLQLRNLFKSVSLYLKKGSKRGNVRVIVEVEEASAVYTETTIQTETSSSLSTRRDTLNFTVGHRNLFGLGKILQVTGDLINGEFDNKSKSFKLDYTDPNLFGSKRLYLNLSFLRSYEAGPSCPDCIQKNEDNSVQGTLGYRVFDFSYFSISSEKKSYESIGEYSGGESRSKSEYQIDKLSYGWNSEDDSYFPTQGEKFNVGVFNERSLDSDSIYQAKGYDATYRHNWLLKESNLFVFKFNFSQKDSFSFSGPSRWYAIPLQYAYIFSHNSKSNIHRSRAFLELAPNFFENPADDGVYKTQALLTSAGYTLEHKRLGIIRFYIGYWSNL